MSHDPSKQSAGPSGIAPPPLPSIPRLPIRKAESLVTPGPWHVAVLATDTPDAPGSEVKAQVRDRSGYLVATIGIRGSAASDNANARFIAAAPETAEERDRLRAERAELLSALRGMESAFRLGRRVRVAEKAAACDAARDAIAKAERTP